MPHPRVGLPLPPRGTRTRPSRGVIVAMRATAYGTSSSRTSARRSRLGSSRVGAGSPRSPRRLIQTERIPSAFRGHDVVKTALGDVDMAPSVRTRGLVERPPVSVGRLVRTDLRRHNRSLERNADRAKRSVDQVAIAVRQSEQSPPPALSLSQGVPDAREHRPIRQRTAQRVVLACRKRHPRLRRIRRASSLPFPSLLTRAVVRLRTRGTARSQRTPSARRCRRCCSRTALGSEQPGSCTSPTRGPRGGRRCRPRER